ncbi:synaptonemal complex central element protein 1-like isoform X2 [Phacochoerus africanus]|uniref:synaptonemal complex central element protein 1-like isoform X2 n=1 Tax=Phacochoerus africanus TaxID=41426 RepID=UPI001FD9EEC9|nr:synaptonemal complex central element protein 1-like isoform X2 [Phacochoerus africanus]
MAMAGELEHVDLGPPEVVEEVEEAEGQTKSLKKTEDLLEMVKKLQKEGSLEPQIEDLINRINELQQAKKKSSEELGEAHALWKALHRELDSLNGEKVHLEEILSKKQEALRILQLHCQRKEGEAQRKYMLAEHADQISIHNSQIAESQGQRKLGWHVELLEASRGQHKDLWEFHVSHYHCLNQSHTSPPQPEPGSLPTGQGPPTAQAQGQGVVLDSLPLTPSTQSFSFYLKPGHLYPPPTPPTATPSICCPDCYSCHRRSCFPPAHLESAHLPVANGFSQPNMVRSFLLNVSECVQQHSTLAKSLLSPSWLWAGGGIP